MAAIKVGDRVRVAGSLGMHGTVAELVPNLNGRIGNVRIVLDDVIDDGGESNCIYCLPSDLVNLSILEEMAGI